MTITGPDLGGGGAPGPRPPTNRGPPTKPFNFWLMIDASDPIGGPYSTLRISEVFRRPTSKKREEKGRKEQGEEGCTVQGSEGEFATVTGIQLLQRSTHN